MVKSMTGSWAFSPMSYWERSLFALDNVVCPFQKRRQNLAKHARLGRGLHQGREKKLPRLIHLAKCVKLVRHTGGEGESRASCRE